MIPIAFVLGLLALVIVLLATEWLRVEVLALMVIVLLAASGTLTPAEAFSGFAGSTVLMIAGVMLLTGAIVRNGAADWIARKIRDQAGRSERKMSLLLLGAVSFLSSIINNVAATAVFIPVAMSMAKWFGRPRSRYLIPVAFASMTGGMCTLIGTSTNIAVSGALERRGLAPLGMFELAPLGLCVVFVACAYLLLVAPRLLDGVGREGTAMDAELESYLFEILVRENACFAGKTIEESDLRSRFGLDVLAIVRGDRRIETPRDDQMIRADDLLLVKGTAAGLSAVRGTAGLQLKALPPRELDSEGNRLAEVTVSFNSPLIGKAVGDARFLEAFGVSVLAVRQREGLSLEDLERLRLGAGDVLLAYGPTRAFEGLAARPGSLLVEMLVLPHYRPRKALTAVAILASAIAATALGWIDPATAFLAGAALVLATGALPTEEAGSYLNLRFLVLIAAMTSLGLAMERSGAAAFVAESGLSVIGTDSPILVMAGLFVVTVFLTQPLNNAAAALLVLPIALESASILGLGPRPFAIAITVAASCSFITPFEPACLLVYSTGHYRFGDFFRVGAGLTLAVGILSMALIPILWPFM